MIATDRAWDASQEILSDKEAISAALGKDRPARGRTIRHPGLLGCAGLGRGLRADLLRQRLAEGGQD